MNIQAKKLVLIEELLRIEDESLISRLESFIRDEKKKLENDLKSMSIKEFHEMIDQAKMDSEERRVISHDDLKKKIKKWK